MMRRWHTRLIVVALTALSIRVLSASPVDNVGQTRWFRYVMGTSMRVEVYDGADADRVATAEEAFGALAEVDRLMSDYRDDSDLTHVNRTAAIAPTAVSAPMFAVLQAADRVSRASDGAFDVTVGPLVQLWGFKDRRAHLPAADELARVRPLVDYRLVQLDAQAQTVHFGRQGVEIDLGGIAKGFAVEIAAGALKRRGVSGMIDAGGNQYLVGRPPGKSAWSLGIRHPDRPGALLGTIDVAGGSISTSSDASNFVTIAGRPYGHIMDPRTLRPSAASLSVTIVSDDGTLADALSKAVYVLGPRDGLALLRAFRGTSAVVAYRQSDGGVGVSVSPGLSFHPASSVTH